MRMLAAAACNVTLLGFERSRSVETIRAGEVVLGRTQNQRLLERVFSVLLAIPRALRAGPAWRDADVVIARNLEMLALVVLMTRFTRPRTRIVYECLDVHRLMLARSSPGAVLRFIERYCLRRTALIVVSSPAFEQRYFRTTQAYAGEILLAENKVLALDPFAAAAGPAETPPWRIAWCGVLRCKTSFEILRDAAARLNLRVDLWGSPALDEIPDFHRALASAPNITFHGRYAPDQLPAIYGSAHFAWAIDFYEAGGNSEWLLPNRLYESLAFGALPIAACGVETSQWLNARGVGVVLDQPIEPSFGAFIEQLTPERYGALRRAVAQLSPSATHATLDDCLEFASRLVGSPP
jgi:succinoglycan biosynthesis protein ExoL